METEPAALVLAHPAASSASAVVRAVSRRPAGDRGAARLTAGIVKERGAAEGGDYAAAAASVAAPLWTTPSTMCIAASVSRPAGSR